MPPTFDLRTYAKLEAALIRHLVKDWKQRSAPIFADIATACRNRQWNEARRRVPELDLHEVGAENKEWIKYHLHSFAVFGAGCVAKQRPSFVGVGTFDTTLNQVAQNVCTYLELTATSQVQTQTLQLIAEDEAMATAPVKVAFDPAQPRDAQGQWVEAGGGTFEEYEAAWAGGVADFGDPESATAIQSHPGYTDYHDQLVAQLTQEHGEKITVYRAVSQDAYEGMEAGEDLGPMGVTTDPDVAKNWAKFAPNALKGAELRILTTTIEPRIAVMRGKEEESEIVVDGNEISFGDWEEMGRATDKGGFVPTKEPSEWHQGRYQRAGGEELVTVARGVPVSVPEAERTFRPYDHVFMGPEAEQQARTWEAHVITRQVPARELIPGDEFELGATWPRPGEARWVPKGFDPSKATFSWSGKSYGDVFKKDTRWDESQHPRNPAGSDAGGEFTTVIKEGMRAYAKKDSDRLKALGVPPDWTDVQVSINPNAGLQATGKDAKGRTQYWYSAEHEEKAAAEKFERVKEFVGVADKVSAQTLKDLESDDPEVREAAAALYVIEKTAFRIGSNAETKADKKAYGVTTLLGKHVRVLEGGRVSFRFPGKSGVLNAKIIKDPVLHKMMSERKGGSDAPLFDTSGDKVRNYMDRTAPGFHPKDYRTHQATTIALLEIGKRKKAKTEKEFKHAQKMVAKIVAAHLGNTPAVAIESYINPAVWGRLRA